MSPFANLTWLLIVFGVIVLLIGCAVVLIRTPRPLPTEYPLLTLTIEQTPLLDLTPQVTAVISPTSLHLTKTAQPIAQSRTPAPDMIASPPTCYEDANGMICLGTVRNMTSAAVGGVVLRAELLQSDGRRLRRSAFAVEQRQIAAGERAPYRVIFDRSLRAGERVQVEALRWSLLAPEDRVLGLAALDESAVLEPLRGGGRYIVTAQVRNETGRTMRDLRAVLTVFDDRGRVVSYRIVAVRASLSPDAETDVRVVALLPVTGSDFTHTLAFDAVP